MPQDDRLWYKDAIIYEVHIRSFYDSDGDGIGDLRGLTQRLDYIEDLGVTAIWLLPFYPSPLKDDGYDIASYTDVHPDYGTLKDFRDLLQEAHRRGLKVITELVLNHTSDQHPWFQRARRAPAGSIERDFYVWNDTPDKYKKARIIFADTKTSNWTWDPVANAYYWHRFYAHQPDLNFDSPHVQKAVMEVVDFWLSMGIDGMRLDAITYLFEREGTNCESLPETHAYLRDLRKHIDERYSDRMLLAEANQWPENAVDYFGENGDECHMTFHFPLMPRLFMAVQMEDRYPVIDILEQTPRIPENCQWATFLRNHDELTLEMVTDEERDFMYRFFAPELRMRINLGIRRRLAPLLNNDERKIKLMYGLLLSLGGTPIIYYGDELGMGDNYHLGDRDGVRTPMQWSADLNAGFSRANPQSLFLPLITDPEYHYFSINVANQENNPTSLLSWMKRLVAIRKQFKAFASGEIEFVTTNNHKVLAFVRHEGAQAVLVVANLSRAVQHVVLDIKAFEGRWPVELWGRTEFPHIDSPQYSLSLGPYSSYWFALETRQPRFDKPDVNLEQLSTLEVKHDWATVFEGRTRSHLEEHLMAYLLGQKWFVPRGRRLESVNIEERIRLRWEDEQAVFCFLQARYFNGDTETYILPVAFAHGRREREIRQQSLEAVIAPLCIEAQDATGILYDALANKVFCQSLLGVVRKGWEIQGQEGRLAGQWVEMFDAMSLPDVEVMAPSQLNSSESHTSIIFGKHLVLKIFRRLEKGTSMDVEIGRYLAEIGFEPVAQLMGHLDYKRGRWEPMTLGTLHAYVPNQGNGWQWAREALGHAFDKVESMTLALPRLPQDTVHLLDLAEDDFSPAAVSLLDSFLNSASALGRRTAELHHALASAPEHHPFAPEPFSHSYERSRYQAMRTLTVRVMRLLRNELGSLPESGQALARQVLDSQEEMLMRFRGLVGRNIGGLRMRIHGDFHLGEVLVQDEDFVIIGFDGHPWLPIGERRIKRSPLRDVASLISSFHHVAQTVLAQRLASLEEPPADLVERLQACAPYWSTHVSAAFLQGYLEHTEGAAFLPEERDAAIVFLDALRIKKALQQLERELHASTPQAEIPLMAILRLFETRG